LLGLAIGALILGGIALGSGPIQLAGSIGAFVAALVSPVTGLIVLAFMAPLKSPPAIPAPGFNTLLVFAILLGFVYRLPIDRPRLRPSLPVVLLLGFLLYAAAQQLPALTAGYADDTSHHIGYLFIQLATLITLTITAALVLRQRDPVPVLAAGLLGALIAAVLAIAVFVLPAGSVRNLVDYPDAIVRVVGPFGDPNYFGLFQATAIAACAGGIVIARSFSIRILLAVTALVLAASMAISLSRAALIALAAGLVVLAFARGRWAGFATIGVLAVLALVAYPLFLQERLTADAGALSVAQASIGLQRSDASRLAAALVGPQMWVTSPIFGIGFGEYPLTTSRFIGYSIESHNWYMNILAEQGLVGVALWMPMLAGAAVRLVHLGSTARTVGVAVFVTYVVGSAFLQPPLSVQTSAFAVILVAAALVGDWRRLPGRPGPAARPIEEEERPPSIGVSDRALAAASIVDTAAPTCRRPRGSQKRPRRAAVRRRPLPDDPPPPSP
jgi:O-antigen ligase